LKGSASARYAQQVVFAGWLPGNWVAHTLLIGIEGVSIALASFLSSE